MTLESLIRKWDARRAEYVRETGDAVGPARQRYEGIATGTRWCIEDLKKALRENKKKLRARKSK